MLKLFVISGATCGEGRWQASNFACQACGKETLEILNPFGMTGERQCPCGQKLYVDACRGNPFAAMGLIETGKSQQTGNPDYWAGWMIRAMA